VSCKICSAKEAQLTDIPNLGAGQALEQVDPKGLHFQDTWPSNFFHFYAKSFIKPQVKIADILQMGDAFFIVANNMKPCARS